MNGYKSTTKTDVRTKKILIAEMEAVREIRRVIHKYRNVGEKRLRELTVLAARSIGPQLGNAMQQSLLPRTTRKPIRKAKRVSKRDKSQGD